MRRTPCSEEVWPSASSAFRYQNRQQGFPVRPRRHHRSEARLSQCVGHSPSRSRSTRHLPFSVCMAQPFSPPSSWPPSLGAVLLPAPLDGLTLISGTMGPLTAATPHPSGSSPRLLHFAFQTSRPQPRYAPTRRFRSHLSACGMFQASPRMSRLAATCRRIGFVILRAAFSPPIAPHPASQRRSYLRLHSCDIL
jgi:hypothetical protein